VRPPVEPGPLDRHLSREVRVILEERFWRPVEEVSTLEALPGDASFVAAPGTHPALFGDHGVVHARDVAAGVVELAGTVEGLLLPARPADRQAFVVGLAVILGYLHDVGMHDATATGRRVHALYAGHLPFSGSMDDVLRRLAEDGSEVPRRVAAVAAIAPFVVAPDVVVRELVSLALAHSKSTVPARLLADLGALRAVLLGAVLVDLEHHRRAGTTPAPDDPFPAELGANARWYADPLRDAYAWLVSTDPAHAALADDAIDAVRLVRAADALRQRGTTLRTAAGYEIFIDAETGRSVYALRTAGRRQLFLLRVDSPVGAGEANVRRAVVTRNGDLRLSFHRGRFSSPASAESACSATARVVADIGADVLGAFAARRPSPDLPPPFRDPGSMRIELERPADEPAFAETVARGLAHYDSALVARAFVVADLESAAPRERARYYGGTTIAAESDEAGAILDALGARGLKVAAIDRGRAFEDVRKVRVDSGEVLIEAGSSPAFVYVPVDCGLRVEQLGGYGNQEVPAWIPIGVTGVVRRAERNSTVVVAAPGDVLIIPGELFAREWFRPYEEDEIADVLATVDGRG
jgi:hypothetical protein